MNRNQARECKRHIADWVDKWPVGQTRRRQQAIMADFMFYQLAEHNDGFLTIAALGGYYTLHYAERATVCGTDCHMVDAAHAAGLPVINLQQADLSAWFLLPYPEVGQWRRLITQWQAIGVVIS